MNTCSVSFYSLLFNSFINDGLNFGENQPKIEAVESLWITNTLLKVNTLDYSNRTSIQRKFKDMRFFKIFNYIVLPVHVNRYIILYCLYYFS